MIRPAPAPIAGVRMGWQASRDDHQVLCFALALWNGKDPILKERLFGLTNSEGNHGEDVKEYYFYLDSTPTHSYMKYLYKYPQAAYPYSNLVETNRRRSRQEMEYELLDTGIFNDNRYFDVVVEYAKAAPEDLLIRISVHNRGPEAALMHLLPTLWFRNTWSWPDGGSKPILQAVEGTRHRVIHVHHTDPLFQESLDDYDLFCEGTVPVLFTENETNTARLFGTPNPSPYVKDGIDNAIVHGQQDAVNPAHQGTKASPHYQLSVEAEGMQVVRLRLRRTRAGSAGRSFRDVRRGVPGAPAGGGCILSGRDAPLGVGGCGQRHAPGPRRHAMEQTILLLQCRHLARGSWRSSPPPGQPYLPQQRLVPHGQ